MNELSLIIFIGVFVFFVIFITISELSSKERRNMMYADNKEYKINTEIKNTRAKVLMEALKCVNGKREEDYGTPEDNFTTIAELWTDYYKHEFTAHDVAIMLALLKIGRIASGRGSLDNYIDLAGYAACAGEIWEKNHPSKIISAYDIQNGALEEELKFENGLLKEHNIN